MKRGLFTCLLTIISLTPDSHVHSAEQGSTCAPLTVSQSGVTWDAHTSAGRFSDQAPGHVGISIFPGGDLVNFTAHELGLRMVEVLKNRDTNIVVNCFVNNSYNEDGATGVGFVVNGVTLKIDSAEFYNMAQIIDDERILNSVVAEASIGRKTRGH